MLFRRETLLFFLFVLISVNPTLALAGPSSKEYGLMGRKMVSAWECFSLAQLGEKNKTELERLFNLGFNEGKMVLKALSEGIISQEDLIGNVSLWHQTVMSGPNVDFVLGRLFSSVLNHNYTELANLYGDVTLAQREQWIKVEAINQYSQRNCELLMPTSE